MMVEKDKFNQFYESYEWRRIRFDVLKESDGKCQLCGRSKHHGIVLNVDHIVPLRRNWKLRLDKRNLQVLCHECNHGKGNLDATDWRQPISVDRLVKAKKKRKKKKKKVNRPFHLGSKKDRRITGTFGAASPVRVVDLDEYKEKNPGPAKAPEVLRGNK